MQIHINGWKSCIMFSSAHFIPDYTKCGHIHGHSYAIHVILDGTIGTNDILFDFREIKNTVKEIAEEIDHKIIVPTKGSFNIEEKKEEIEIKFKNKRYVFPSNDCFFLPYPASSAEYLAKHILNNIMKKIQIPSNIEVIKVGVDEGPGQGAWIEKRLQ